MKLIIIFLALVFSFASYSQAPWSWNRMDDLPMATSNNSVCEAKVGGSKFVYSFGGIDTSKVYSGIHQRSFKYNVAANFWQEIDTLPDTLGKIAAGASFINNKIYIIGGYHVLQNGSEISSNKVHVYNPTTDEFEADAAPLPLAIDDHVQAIWRDTLIYVVTGWSNSANRPDVQIFSPEANAWSAGTSVPNNNNYKAFGASGYILGDTIYYFGGVTGSASFYAVSHFRKGVINPSDPTDITWTLESNSPSISGYRAACGGTNDKIFWVGGSSTGYNFDGIQYGTSVGVDPETRILNYSTTNSTFSTYAFQPHGVMDLRGIADLGNGYWMIAGGMDSMQVVSDKSYLLYNPDFNDLIINNPLPPYFEVFQDMNNYIVKTEYEGMIRIFTINGKLIYEKSKLLSDMLIPKSVLSGSVLLFSYDDGENIPVILKKVNY